MPLQAGFNRWFGLLHHAANWNKKRITKCRSTNYIHKRVSNKIRLEFKLDERKKSLAGCRFLFKNLIKERRDII